MSESDKTNFDLVEFYLERSKREDQFQKEKAERPKYFQFDTAGLYNFRIIFAGNDEENIPFLAYNKHSYYEPAMKTGYKYRDTICWDYLIGKDKLVEYLAERGRISRQDLQQYQIGKCPFCVTYKAMLNAGVKKEDISRMKKELRYLFNVYFNGKEMRDGSLDSEKAGFYVWECGQSNFDKVMEPYMREKRKDIDLLDLNKGYNLTIKAVGENKLRRYHPEWDRSPSPFARELEIKDFKALMAIKFIPYQTAIDRIKNEFNVTLTQMQYLIAGDMGTGNTSNENLADKYFSKDGGETKEGIKDKDDIPF